MVKVNNMNNEINIEEIKANAPESIRCYLMRGCKIKTAKLKKDYPNWQFITEESFYNNKANNFYFEYVKEQSIIEGIMITITYPDKGELIYKFISLIDDNVMPYGTMYGNGGGIIVTAENL
jgi:hypothetical protein